jgi:cytochrome c oxidase subunit 2
MWDFPLFPDRASSLAGQVDAVFCYALAITLFFTMLICVLILTLAIRYRRGAKVDRSHPMNHNTILEVTWISIPLLLALVLFAWATVVYFDVYKPPADASELYVQGRQWMWEIRHPGGKRELNELHVPVNRDVKLTMTSEDVIHSFFIPAFRTKQDVVPGRYSQLWFRPTRTGRFHLFCAEYCGTKHSGMIGWVVVMEPADYERWLGTGSVGATLAAEGAKLFKSYGCSGCHGLNASVRAPLLDGVFGHPVPLETGQVITADERYIRDSIYLPKSEVVAGYKPVMPTFKDHMGEDDLLKILAYIKSLGSHEAQGSNQPVGNTEMREQR